MDFTILHFAIHIVWRANVICTYRKSGIARKTTVAYPELRLLDKYETLVSDLAQGLPAEIAAVQEQYEYYRDKLLSFSEYKLSA